MKMVESSSKWWKTLRNVEKENTEKRRICSFRAISTFATVFSKDLYGRKFFKLVENTVRKGEIARSKQFLLFPQCF